MEIPDGKDQKCKVILHQLPQAGLAQDRDCGVMLTCSIIFWSWPQLQIVFFQEEVSIWVEFTGANIGQLHAVEVEVLGDRQKTVKQVVSLANPRQFHNILSWFKVEGRIIV